MKKIIKSWFFLVIVCSLTSGLSYAESADDPDEELISEESESSEQPVAPAEIKDLPAAPTLKELADKRKAEEETLKKLAEAPVAGLGQVLGGALVEGGGHVQALERPAPSALHVVHPATQHLPVG